MAHLFIPVMKPQLPTAEMLAPFLSQIDSRRTYSNFGPFVQRFQDRLAEMWRLPSGSVLTVSNGTLALMMALQHYQIPAGHLCLMPSWTFTATASAALACGLRPYFMDVNPTTWTLDPLAVQEWVQTSNLPIGAIIVVAPFGQPLDVAAWEQVQKITGLPVIIDAAAGFDSFRPSTCLTMISLHATKAFGVGEGGLLVSTDTDLIEDLRQRSVFGFRGQRVSQLPGMNAKISEFTAAVGLAMLDLWPQMRRQLLHVGQLYQKSLMPFLKDHLSLQADWGQHWVSSTCNVLLKGGNTRDLSAHLSQAGIDSRRWWELPLHQQPAYQGLYRDLQAPPLPTTEYLGDKVLGLPFYTDLSRTQVHHICQSLAQYLEALPKPQKKTTTRRGRWQTLVRPQPKVAPYGP